MQIFNTAWNNFNAQETMGLHFCCLELKNNVSTRLFRVHFVCNYTICENASCFMFSLLFANKQREVALFFQTHLFSYEIFPCLNGFSLQLH